MKSLETKNTVAWVEELLGTESARELLEHRSTKIPKEMLHLPGPDFVDRIFMQTDRPQHVINNLQRLFNTGRLSGAGNLGGIVSVQGTGTLAGNFTMSGLQMAGGTLELDWLAESLTVSGAANISA